MVLGIAARVCVRCEAFGGVESGVGSGVKLLGRYREPAVLFFFFFNDTATTEIYTLSLHDALPIWAWATLEHLGSHQGVNSFGLVLLGLLMLAILVCQIGRAHV